MGTFNPKQLTLARARRGMKKGDLATKIDVSARSVTEYEAGRTQPSEDTLVKIAELLQFPIEFFSSPELDMPLTTAVSFRALTSMTAAQRYAALGAGGIAYELSRWIEERFSLPDSDLPDLRELANHAGEAADSLRQHWALGLTSIRSVVHLLELHGVRVFSLAEQCRELDAFSVWNGARPFCFLNTIKSVEHSRFDAAHELGHLVLHRHGQPSGREAEQQANDFASAFLMPRSTVIANVPRGASLSKLIELKKIWGVSLAALAYRSHKLGILTDWHYRSLCIDMARRGYRTNEPAPIANRETSQILTKVFSALREEGIGKADVARELRIFPPDLDALVFGLVLTPVEGGRPSTQSPAVSKERASRLRLV